MDFGREGWRSYGSRGHLGWSLNSRVIIGIGIREAGNIRPLLLASPGIMTIAARAGSMSIIMFGIIGYGNDILMRKTGRWLVPRKVRI